MKTAHGFRTRPRGHVAAPTVAAAREGRGLGPRAHEGWWAGHRVQAWAEFWAAPSPSLAHLGELTSISLSGLLVALPCVRQRWLHFAEMAGDRSAARA